ncbi:MAG TPA: ribbon-helix-helix protein, CopG family [Acidobacteriota bacterium]|nr:ribbon-helix-helix protein, CopG family [Acidobacteriota bacterium]
MSTSKITISIDQTLLQQLDLLVQERVFSSRSQAFQEALQAKLREIRRQRFDAECRKFDPQVEQAFADFS